MTTLNHNNKTINIVLDETPESPREWCNLGTMNCLHSRYELGDSHDKDEDELKFIENSKDYISLPIFMYEHSGTVLNTTGFSCQWDSGQVGVIYISREQVRQENSVKRISPKLKAKVLEYLANEVATYDHYMNGDVYGFEILGKDGEIEDSCYGYYGEESAIEAAKEAA